MILTIVQVIVAIALVGAILLQAQGNGLSGAFGGSSQMYRSKRSMERMLVWATILLAVVFALLSIVLLLPHK